MKKDKVTAIITTHNRIDVLPRAIKSVLNQTYENIELIVVSDGQFESTDRLMEEFTSNPIIRYISYNPAKGGNHARNQGILNANGEYIAFLDDDDEWLPEKIEKQMEIILGNDDIGLVYAGKNIIYVNQDINYKSIPAKPKVSSESILISNFIGSTSCVLVRKNALLQCGMFDENLKAFQDFDLWIRICQKYKVDVVSMPLINYYNYTNSNQISDKTNLYEQSIRFINNKYKELYDKLSDSQRRQHTYQMNLLLAQKCVRNKQGVKARKYLYKAYQVKKGITPIVLSILSYFPFYVNLFLRKILSK